MMDEDLLKELRSKVYKQNVKISYLTTEYKKLIEKLDETEEELDNYKRCTKNLLRINKERENAKRGLYPKKEHTGYCLIQATPINYKYYLHGSHKEAFLFQSIFQTPYDIEFDYYETYDMVMADLKNNDFYIMKALGAEHSSSDKKYEELVDEEMEKLKFERWEELKEEYKKENGWYGGTENEHELHEQAYSEELYYFFNFEVRLNAKEGYWELTMQSTSALPKIPRDLRFKKGDKNGTKEKDV